VQGVGFRWFVRRSALRLGLEGDVRNEPGGTVEVRARGGEERLGELLRLLQSGPTGARVDGVDTLEVERDAEFDGFEIRL
jgi:acylphosphatase